MSIPYKDHWIWPGMTNGVIHLTTGRFIPKDPRNKDWRKFEQWKLDTGFEPLPHLENIEAVKIKQREHVAFGRTSKINEVLWMVERHRQEKELNLDTSLTEEQYVVLLQYIQGLRDVTDALGSTFITWPEKPNFV